MGRIELTETGSFSWRGYERLTPQILGSDWGEEGYLTFDLGLSLLPPIPIHRGPDLQFRAGGTGEFGLFSVFTTERWSKVSADPRPGNHRR
jgi:hypothetical protein